MRKLAIFDLDGTLLNTIEDLGAAANYALELNGYPAHCLAAYPAFVGNGVRKLIQRVLPEDKQQDEDINNKMLVDFIKFYDEHNTDLSHPYPGINDLLKELQQRDIKIAVASNKYQTATTKLIKYFFPNIDFLAVEGQREGIQVKPDPSIVFQILAKSEIAKCDVIYIGDSAVDIETARRACVSSIGVTWGFRSRAELESACAENIATSPADVLKIILLDNTAKLLLNT